MDKVRSDGVQEVFASDQYLGFLSDQYLG